MKQAVTILLTAAYALVAVPAFADDQAATTKATDSTEAKTETKADPAADKKAKAEADKKAKAEAKAKAAADKKAKAEAAAKAKADAKAKASETQSTDAETKADDKAKSDDKASDDKAKAGDDKTKAADDKTKTDGDKAKTDGDKTDGKKASKGKTPAKGNLATRAVSFVAGSIVGMPVAIAREIGGETKIATRDLVGETNNWFKIIPALPMGFIGGCLSAAPQGLMFGVKNAWEGSHDEPFGREAFSLADELEK